MIEWQQYENTPTLELIGLIKKSSDSLNAEAAFHAFTFRFFQSVTDKCEIICGRWGYDHHFAADIAQIVFKKFGKYPNYNHEKSNCNNVDNGVLLYLQRIAFTSIVDQIKVINGIGISPYTGDEHIIKNLPTTDENDDRQKIILKAISSFSPKHKIIFLTYKMHEQEGFKLPRALLLELRQELGLSQTTIRFYKYEVINKIKEHLQIWDQTRK